MLEDETKRGLERMRIMISVIGRELEALPEGRIVCGKNGRYVKWMVRRDGRYEVLGKDRRPYAAALVRRRYLVLLLDELRYEERAAEHFLSVMDRKRNRSGRFLDKNSPYFPLLAAEEETGGSIAPAGRSGAVGQESGPLL